ncbi:MAG: transcriptional regulator [Bacteroidales bacterium]|nr:transcriptional regulator [Bacteroidales bacterium]MDD3549202.1 transcriptional regulator [Bacteroidales bacterium]MDD5282976.1 transcriptional regulator [Bacteroidales bacterium]
MKKKHNSEIFIGKIIEQKVKESHLSVSQFASLISRSRTTIYDIFNRKSIDIDLLLTISEVLDYDFLTEIYVPQRKDPAPRKCYLAIEVDPSAIPADVREVSSDQKNRVKILLKERLMRKSNGV